MEAFEPPKYIASLIAAMNDGAKSAQLGALAFTAIGLFLLATAFSATDEDLLLNRALTISQLGNTAVPVVFAFGLAPLVFVAVHYYTLIRYDMLAGNIRRFVRDLETMVRSEADRDRCRQLLANVEFVNARTMPKWSRASSPMFRLTAWALLAVFPVVVLLIVQLQSLRLQSQWVNWTHRVCIIADLGLLIWIFGWRLRGDASWHFCRAQTLWTMALCSIGAVLVLTGDRFWLEVPEPASETVGRQGLVGYEGWASLVQPVDLLACHPGAWGCRFLTVSHHVITGKVWDTATFVALRAGADLDAKHLASFEVAQLGERTLRYADLSGSELFGASLYLADLYRADLQGANLQGADLLSANLTGAKLNGANLTSANLSAANLTGADLTGANLTGANLNDANLTRADLSGANLTGTKLFVAKLIGIKLNFLTKLTNADLSGADLTHADLRGAADLTQMQLDEACGTDTKLSPGLTLNKPCLK
jgi:uncharacterized protein YjbI with pentapeptide repeats